MKQKLILFGATFIAMLALVSCAKEAKQQAAETDATPTALVTFDVQGMTCGGCETNVKLALKDVEGVQKVEANYKAAEAKITVNPEKVKEKSIIEALSKIGYTAKKKGEKAMSISNNKHELLGEINLALKKMERVSNGDFHLGSYIGSGDGRYSGEKLRGNVLWDLAEAQSALQCPANFRGKIETDDGAMVEFDVLGFFRRKNETSALWDFTGGVTFHTDDARYAWLHGAQGVWEGQSDLSAYTHTSRVYLGGE